VWLPEDGQASSKSIQQDKSKKLKKKTPDSFVRQGLWENSESSTGFYSPTTTENG